METDTRFGLILLGAPGTGKSTLCSALSDFYTNVLNRRHCIINLDPANDQMDYQVDIDIRQLIDLEDVMQDNGLGLGPNGGMLYCLQFLETNIKWLQVQIQSQQDCKYFIFDMPGQVELYTNHDSLKKIIKQLNLLVGMQSCCAHLVDSSYLMDSHKYLSACCLSMTTKIGFEENPIINILTKIDLLAKLGRPQMNLIDLENFSGLSYLFWGQDDPEIVKSPFQRKFGKLSKSLSELLEIQMGCSEGFLLCDLNNKELLCHIIGKIDKANGYFYQPEKLKNEREAAIDYEAIEIYVLGEAVSEIYEKYIDGNADINFDTGLKFAGKLEDRILQSQINPQEINKNL